MKTVNQRDDCFERNTATSVSNSVQVLDLTKLKALLSIYPPNVIKPASLDRTLLCKFTILDAMAEEARQSCSGQTQ